MLAITFTLSLFCYALCDEKTDAATTSLKTTWLNTGDRGVGDTCFMDTALRKYNKGMNE